MNRSIMELGEEKPEHGKLSRKIGEKLRRDRLNSLITQLAEEIPMIKYAHRRLDKSAVLRLAVSYLKLHYGLKKNSVGGKYSGSQLGLLNWCQKIVDYAVVIVSQTGGILYVSTKITEMTGFYQTDMIGFNISQFVHPDDLYVLMSQFSANHSQGGNSASAAFRNQQGISFPEDLEIQQSEHNYFYLRMSKALRKKKLEARDKEYEVMTVRAFIQQNAGFKTDDDKWMVALIKPLHSHSVSEIDVKISEFTMNNEFASMHDLDSRILVSDQRSSLFHGFLVSEIVGKTPFMLICDEDLESVALSHKIIMKTQETPCTVFRMVTRTNSFLYIESKSIIVKDKWTNKPKCILSVNKVLESDVGKHKLSLQKQKTDAYKLEQMQVCGSPSSIESVDADKSDDNDDNYLTDSGNLVVKSCEIHKQSLKQIYDKTARSVPDLYVDSNSSCSSSCMIAEKRSVEILESEENDTNVEMAGDVSDVGLEVTSENVSVSGDKKGSDSPCLRGLLNHSKRNKKSRGDGETGENENQGSGSISSSLPLLKGILEGSIEMGIGRLSSVKMEQYQKQQLAVDPEDSDCTHTEENNKQCERTKDLLRDLQLHRTSVDESLESSQQNEQSEDVNIASGRGIQSPTVGSSEIKAFENGNEDVTVHSVFATQLWEKHGKMAKTLELQTSTLQDLKNQIDQSQKLGHLNAYQQRTHEMLIRKLSDVETEVQAQRQCLVALERELSTNK